MDVHRAAHGHLVGHREAGELVPEHHVAVDLAQQTSVERLVDRGEAVGEQVDEQAGLGAGARERDDLQGALRLLVEPGHPREHGVTHRGRHPPGARREGLGDEEGVAAGDPEQLSRVGARRLGMLARVLRDEAAHGIRGEWGKVDASRPGGGCRVAQQDSQSPNRRGVLGAVGHEHQGTAPVDAPREEPDQVEGRLVGPVRVLDDQEAGRVTGRVGEGGEEAREDVLAGRAGRPDPARQVGEHLDERAEGRGCRGPVAGPHGDGCARTGVGDHPRGEGRLADAGLPGDVDQAAVTGRRLGQVVGAGAQLLLSFQEHHGPHGRPVRRHRTGPTADGDADRARPAAGAQPAVPAGSTRNSLPSGSASTTAPSPVGRSRRRRRAQPQEPLDLGLLVAARRGSEVPAPPLRAGPGRVAAGRPTRSSSHPGRLDRGLLVLVPDERPAQRLAPEVADPPASRRSTAQPMRRVRRGSRCRPR